MSIQHISIEFSDEPIEGQTLKTTYTLEPSFGENFVASEDLEKTRIIHNDFIDSIVSSWVANMHDIRTMSDSKK